MQTYSGTIRLAGSLYNEVSKSGMTPAEVILLRKIHGSDAVVDLEPSGEINRTDTTERRRLEDIYGAAFRRDEKLRSIENVLGVSGMALPKALADVTAAPVKRKRIVVAEDSASEDVTA